MNIIAAVLQISKTYSMAIVFLSLVVYYIMRLKYQFGLHKRNTSVASIFEGFQNDLENIIGQVENIYLLLINILDSLSKIDSSHLETFNTEIVDVLNYKLNLKPIQSKIQFNCDNNDIFTKYVCKEVSSAIKKIDTQLNSATQKSLNTMLGIISEVFSTFNNVFISQLKKQFDLPPELKAAYDTYYVEGIKKKLDALKDVIDNTDPFTVGAVLFGNISNTTLLAFCLLLFISFIIPLQIFVGTQLSTAIEFSRAFAYQMAVNLIPDQK